MHRAIGTSFWVFFALAAASGTACWIVLGPDAFWRSLGEDVALVIELAPKLAGAAQVAAFVPILLSGEMVSRMLGDHAGLRAIAIAAGIGAVTPGGPITSFPLVAALRAAGSGELALIAFVTSWSTLGMQRILMWELPLMGEHFTLLRILVSIPLPFVAVGMAMMIVRHGSGRA
ncbi:hypothetical protein [Ancylobacter polymorphus]|jgi:uncharacterized membrane protein YraQ (UPF0718 family)|uniref:Uncharacterized membrane protein YraQ (UPF0718 family) n=1 Tax=Ancylobacter polymorphus TaxID=223390 RepID=A0ABU0BGI5_9HYPH|nr:hypothetical protein [Ancylobacter polymorphus]MDQ0304947.1 uncharacterized membrane protein YraQ (UPF0718 family) [Ancylobacter polymorphus]